MSQSRRDYGFPYEPYSIQYDLMNSIYDSIEQGKVSIIESPTGTGKSLSIICAIFKWIEDYKKGYSEDLKSQIAKLKIGDESKTGGDAFDWITAQTQERSKSKEIDGITKTLAKFDAHIEYAKDLRRRVKFQSANTQETSSKITIQKTKRKPEDDVDDSELIIDFNEEDGLLDALESEDRKKKDHDDQFRPKIYYCSRTHSQLTQFIQEIKKTKYCAPNTPLPAMLLPLSSRMNYCINPEVNRYENINMINEKCNELQNSKAKCPLYRYQALTSLQEETLSQVSDLEDIVKTGRRLKACPYYGSRLAVKEAEVVVLPYNILFHQGTRESFGLSLKDSIVVVDEAHNLLETLASVYSISMRGGQIKCLYDCLMKYLTRYYKKFNPQNLELLKQLIGIVRKLVTFMKNLDDKDQEYSLNSFDFVIKLGLESVDVFHLIKFIDQSHLASKLYMFSLRPGSSTVPEDVPEPGTGVKKNKTSGTLAFLNKIKEQNKKGDKKENDKNLKNKKAEVKDQKGTQDKEASQVKEKEPEVIEPYNSNYMYIFKEFLQSLKDVNVDGKVLVDLKSKNLKDSTLKYVLLSASSHFKDILLDCRSVILCGGTMKPFEDYIDQLCKPLKIPPTRILTLSCDHVIPPTNLIALGCGKSPTNSDLNFAFKSRSTEQTIKQTGLTIVELCQVIPKGVVVFFPSYDYMDIVMKAWLRTGVMHQLSGTKKRVFKEQRNSAGTAGLLTSYAKYINAEKENGAILFSVIGGKMSEGINFSDNLGRGVIVVGLPYANRGSLELTAKMDYLAKFGPEVANEYYENLCMRAVNQSIGRAIRHRNDFAAIILLDDRYCHKKVVQNKLPDWIKSKYRTCGHFREVTDQITTFFQDKNL